MYAFANIINAAVAIADSLLFLYTLVIIASAVISWVQAPASNQIVRIINQLTYPAFQKVRSFMPTYAAGIDFAPIIVLVAISLIRMGILPSIAQWANTIS
jgi:uncharacterized protein YggT (Ycf19 family)